MQKFFKCLLLLLITLALATCAPPKRVIRKGVLMTEQEAATYDFAVALKFFNAKKYKDAAINFEALVNNFPKSRLAADSLYKLYQIWEALKDPKKAQAALERLVLDYPLSDMINDARFALAKSYIKENNLDGARTALASINLRIYDQPKQLEILNEQRSVLKGLGLWWELASCDIRIWEIITDFSTMSEIREEILDLVESKLSIQELWALVSSKKGSYPADTALFKLAKIYYHSADQSNARSALEELTRNYPLSEFYREGSELLERLEMRRRASDPRAVGVLLPLSGPNAPIGELALKGIWLASGFYAKKKGSLDDLKILIRDTEGNADVAAKAFDDLVLNERVIGIIGPMMTKASEAVALKAQSTGVPTILLNQSEALTEIGDFVFRNFISKKDQARALARFAVEELKIRRFAFMWPQHPYGSEFIDYFWDELAKYPDTEVRGAEAYPPELDDFSEPIRKLTGLWDIGQRADEICKDSARPPQVEAPDSAQACWEKDKLPPVVDFEALVIPDNFDRIRQIAPSLMYYDVKGVQLLGGNLWNSENIFKENNSRYIQGAVITDTFFKSSKRTRAQEVTKLFKSAFDEDPDVISIHSYEAMSIMMQALSQSGIQDPSALRQELARGRTFEGILGPVAFDGSRNMSHDLFLLIVDSNQFLELD